MMGRLQFLVFLTFICVIQSELGTSPDFLTDFCNPINENNERVPRDGYFQPPNMDCPTYAIVCQSNGMGFLQYCPKGQVFLNSACISSPRQCGGEDEIDCRQYPGRKMVAKGCSRDWYWCTDGRMTKHKCNADRYFNPANDQCDFFENVNACTGRDVIPTTLKPFAGPVVYPINCVGKRDNNYVDPTSDCTQIFYTCANEIVYPRQCPADLYFDAELMNCERRENIPNCGGKRPTNPPPLDFPCADDGNYALPKADACTQNYITCNGGAAKKTFCSDPKHAYNPITRACDVKKNVLGCDPGYCEGKKDGRYPTPGSNGCDTNYLECVFERSYIRSCPATLFYNTKSTNCEWKMDIVECGEPEITLPKVYDTYQPVYQQPTLQPYVKPLNNYIVPKPADTTYCVGKTDGRYLVPGGKGCDSSYLECTHGVSLTRPCPQGLVFNQMTTNCEWPSTVEGCSNYQPLPTYAPAKAAEPVPYRGTPLPSYVPAKAAEPVPYPETPLPLYVPVKAEPVLYRETPLPSYNQEKRDTEPWGNTCKGKADGFYHVSECSRMFVGCFNNKNQMYKCPDDYVYSSKDGRCVYPQSLGKCNTKNPAVDFMFCTGKQDGAYPYQQCSVIYIVCRESKTVVLDCTLGQAFNSASGQCDDLSRVAECKSDESPVPTYAPQLPPQLPQLPPQLPPQPPAISFVPDDKPSMPVAVINTPTCPSNVVGVFSRGVCIPEYYSCINGQLKQYSCIEGSVFGIASSSCAPLNECLENYNSLYPTLPPPEDNSACPSDVVGLYTKDLCVQEYFSCYNGQVLSHACQVGAVFDNSVGQCVEQDLCTVLSNPNDQMVPLIVPGTNMDVVISPMSCGPNEYFEACPRLCESTCPRRYRSDCYTDERCRPACHCRPGFSRRLSSNLCIPNFLCYGGFSEERGAGWYRPGGPGFFNGFRRGGYPRFGGPGYPGRRDFGDYRRGGRPDFDDYRGDGRRDWEDNSRHDSDETERDTGINDDDDKFFCAEREDGYYAMPGDLCTELYYKCRRSKVDFWRCGKGKSFDSVKQRCVSRPRTCWTSVTSLPEFFCQGKYEQSNYTFPFPDCSKKYYSCAAGVPVVNTCDTGYVFSNKEKHCVKSRRCRRETSRDADPDQWFCTDKIDHGFSFPKQTCSSRYYQCSDSLASFRICPDEHVFDGFSCVPKQYCVSVDDKADTLDNVGFLSADLIKTSAQCSSAQEPSAFVITGNDKCDNEFGFCFENKTTVHKCGKQSSFTYTTIGVDTTVECTTLTECLPKLTNSDALENRNFPEADDFCSGKKTGFYTEKECGQKYALCYCSNDNPSICNSQLLRLTCPDRRYIFDSDVNQCVLRRSVKKCNKEFDAKDYCHGRKRSKHELYPCSKSYLDCESYELRYCSKGLLYNERYGCGRYNQCYRRRPTYSADLYYPGPELYSDFDMEYNGPNEIDFVPPPFSDVARSSLFNQPSYPPMDGQYKQPLLPSSSYNRPPYQSPNDAYQPSSYGNRPLDQLFNQRPRQNGRSGYPSFSNGLASTQDQQFPFQASAYVQPSPGNSYPPQSPVNSYRPPVQDNSYRPPVQDNSYRPPVQDNSYRPPVQDNSYRPPVQDNSYRPPVQDNSYRPPVQDNSYRPPVQDNSYRPPVYPVSLPDVTPKPLLPVYQPDNRPVLNPKPLPVYQPVIRPDLAPKQLLPTYQPAKPSVEPISYQGTPEGPEFCYSKPDGYYRLPSDCSKFVQCFSKITNIMKCATGLVFNPHQGINGCDYPSQVPECNFVSVGSDLSQTPECIGKENGAFLRVPTDCNRFQRCVFGRLYDFNCPSTTVFNIKINACDWPDNVAECGSFKYANTYQQ